MVFVLAILVIATVYSQINICLASYDNLFAAQLEFLTEKYAHIENELRLVKEENCVLRKHLEIISKVNAEIKAELSYVQVEMKSGHPFKKDKPNNIIDSEDSSTGINILNSTKKLKMNTMPNSKSGHHLSNLCRVLFGNIHKENNDQIKEKKRLLLDTVTPSPAPISKIAFTAILTQMLSLGQHQTVEYDKVITNVGNGYDSRHGHFIAPVKGVYLMACSIMNVSGANAEIEMVKNGERIAHMYGEKDFSMGNQVTIVVLEKGDMVWIRHGGGTQTETLNSGEYNTFSGTILFEI